MTFSVLNAVLEIAVIHRHRLIMKRLGHGFPGHFGPVFVICAFVGLDLGIREHTLNIALNTRTHRQQVGVTRLLNHAEEAV